jgi:hypothetical protein
MTDIALTYSGQVGDLDLTGHRLNLISGSDAIRQQVIIRCKFFYEEWFLDERLGIPYFRDILIKNPNLDLVRSLYRQTILGTPGVATLPTLDLDLDTATRELTVTFVATTDTGETLEFQPFIVGI